jgi:DNA-binding SARP family transcriptional activator
VVHRGRAVSTDRLVDALWPDGDAPDGASRSVRTYLSRLRAVLPADSIKTNGAGYALDPSAVVVDADEFGALLDAAERAVPDVALARYDEACALWRDVPFGEFTGEWWAVAESSRLVERRLLGEEQRATILMSIGHHDRAVPELDHLVAGQPLRERPVLPHAGAPRDRAPRRGAGSVPRSVPA